MKKCYECGTEMHDSSTICPKCGAPQSKFGTTVNSGYVNVSLFSGNVWDSPVFVILSFVASVLFVLGALIFLVNAFMEWEFIFAGIVLFLAAVINLVSALPKLLKQFTNK